MKIEISDYILENAFESLRDENEEVIAWFTSTNDRDGWIILWPDGETFHTYHYPPDWFFNV